jgi:hypothetical protein
MVGARLQDASLRRMLDGKDINPRQYALVRHVIEAGMPIPGKVLRADPRYIALYARLTARTAARDLRQLVELGLLAQDSQGRWMPGPRQG